MAATPIRSIGILAFDEMEVLDFAGPFEVFNVASEHWPTSAPEVAAIGVRGGPIRGRGGFTVVPQITIADESFPDLLVVPGGPGSRAIIDQPSVLHWVRAAAGEAQIVLSVCTGALVLAAAGLLRDRDATTHHDAFDELAALSPTTSVVRGQRFVRGSDRVWTSAGVSAGIDLALHAVEDVAGVVTRELVEQEMEWGW